MYQHGDISLHKCDEKPKNLKKLDTNILAYGESSGHQHELVKGKYNLYETEDKQRLLEVLTPTCLRHWNVNTNAPAEHKTLEIQPQIYWIKHEQKYNPFTKQLERVAD